MVKNQKKEEVRNLECLDQCVNTMLEKIEKDVTNYLDQEVVKYAGESSNTYMVKYGLLTELLDELKSKIDIGDD